MNAFIILLKDELKGFYKSNIMIALWIGMPLITILINYLMNISKGPEAQEMPVSFFFALIISSMGGTLASIMLAVNIIHESGKNVFELFLIRPISRNGILLSKFFAALICVSIASILSLFVGVAYDYINNSMLLELILNRLLETLALSIMTLAVSCAAGVLVGVITNSVLVGVILIFFVTSNLAPIVLMIPTLLELPYPFLLTNVFGIALTFFLMFISKMQFDTKQF